MIPRGIRNNNPGNLRRTKDPWMGLAPEQNDADFFVFSAPVWGLRALMIVLVAYYVKHGLNTVRALINRWAPPNENDTGSYQNTVAKRLGVGIDQPITVNDPNTLIGLAVAIVQHENGWAKPDIGYPPTWYEDDVYAEAASRALGLKV